VVASDPGPIADGDILISSDPFGTARLLINDADRTTSDRASSALARGLSRRNRPIVVLLIRWQERNAARSDPAAHQRVRLAARA
jgi:hypothetical protein